MNQSNLLANTPNTLLLFGSMYWCFMCSLFNGNVMSSDYVAKDDRMYG